MREQLRFESKGARIKPAFSLPGTTRSSEIGLKKLIPPFLPRSAVSFSLSTGVFDSMAFFPTPNLIFTTEQIAATPELELAFEHLQRNVGVHETISTALRVNEIFDRETVVGFDIAEAWMKPNAADFGVDLPGGSIAHKRGV